MDMSLFAGGVAAYAADLAIERFQHLARHTSFVMARKGLAEELKREILIQADLQHLKALHDAVQAKTDINKSIPFPMFLRHLAEAEEEKEKIKKGGYLVSGL